MAERHVMRIIVCVKQIAHTYARTGKELNHYCLSPEDVVFRINPYDELAVAAALKAKELTGSSLEKKGEMLTDNIRSQVDGFISFLQLNDFLETIDKKSKG